MYFFSPHDCLLVRVPFLKIVSSCQDTSLSLLNYIGTFIKNQLNVYV